MIGNHRKQVCSIKEYCFKTLLGMSMLACVNVGMNDNHPVYHMGMIKQSNTS